MIKSATIYNEDAGTRETCRAYSGEIVGASFYDDETGLMRKTPRLYVDLDEDIPVGHCRVCVVEIPNTEKGNTND